MMSIQVTSVVVTEIPPPPPPPSVLSRWLDSLRGSEAKNGQPIKNISFFGTLAKCFWSFPVVVCTVELLLFILLSAAVVSFYGLPKFDDASKGVEARGTPIHDRLIAFENLLQEKKLFSVVPNGADIASTPDEPEVQSKSRPVEDLCGSPDVSGFRMVFESSSPSQLNLLSRNHLISMCRHDDDIVRNTSHFQTACRKDPTGRCCATWSLANYIANMNNRSSCFDIRDGDVDRTKTLLKRCAPFYTSGSLKPGCSEDKNCSSRVPAECSSNNEAVYFIFYAFTPGSFSSAISTDDADLNLNLHMYPLTDDAEEVKSIYLENIYHQSLDDGVTKVTGIGVDTRKVKLSTYSNALRGDFVYVGIGCAVIVAIIWIYMESFLTAILVLLQMGLSLILGYFFHFVVFRFAFFPFMSLLAVILVVAVGADDAFIFIDIWRKNLKMLPEAPRVDVLRTTLEEASLSMFVTSFTNSAALFVTAISAITTVRFFAVYSGIVILANFCLTVIWLPPAVMVSEKYIKRRKLSKIFSAKHIVFFSKTKRKICDIINSFFKVYLPKFVLNFRYVWLMLFPVLFIGSLLVVFFKPGLSLPSGGGIEIYKPTHPMEMYDQVLKKEFDFENANVSQLPIIVVWGIIPLDNGNHWDPDDRGHVLLDTPLNLSNEDSQQWLWDFCQEVRQQSFYQKSTIILEDCFIESFRQFMQQPCGKSAADVEVYQCCDQVDTFPYPSVLLEECLPQFIAERCKRYPCHSPVPGPRFGPNNSVSAFYVQFESSVQERFEYQETNEFWKNATAWVSDQMESAPAGLHKGWFVTFSDKQPYFLDNTLSFASGARTSLSLSIALAAGVVLLSTRNIIMVLLIILSIGGAVIMALAALVFAGWELNVFESSMMALIVGLTVDFTLHYGVAYLHGPDIDRRSRSRYSISSLSRANSMAALSSFIAGSLMLPADVIIFNQLGIALQIIMVCSWATGTFFFISLCRALGPEKNNGQLSSVCKKSGNKALTPII